MDLKAIEAAEAIERAFAAQVIEDDICGSWGRVRQDLGVAGALESAFCFEVQSSQLRVGTRSLAA